MRGTAERAANAKLWWQACLPRRSLAEAGRLHESRLAQAARLPLQNKTLEEKESV
jgi:hypothetical protein